MTKLFLDDIRNPPSSDWTVVRSADAAMTFCRVNGCPVEISFDHDLGPEPLPTGYDFAKWLVERDLDAPGFIPPDFTFTVHSANPPGRINITALLENYLEFRAQ